MSFNIGLSALNAAQQDINTTGNNIANAGTTGFKSSRANFGDVYAASVLGSGGSQQGSGVSLQSISQNFSQGNVKFTNNTMDMAINGEGFFVLDGPSGANYSRAGNFGTDSEGNIVNGKGDRLQGFRASDDGVALGGGPVEDLVIDTGEIPPRGTTRVDSEINLDASAEPSTVIGANLETNGGRSTDPLPLALGDPRLNGYTANTLEVSGSDGTSRLIDVPANAPANEVAQLFSTVNGVAARGSTSAYITGLSAGISGFSINGREFTVDDSNPDHLADLVSAINDSSPNLSARLVDNGGTDVVEVTHNVGADLVFTPGTAGAGTITIDGSQRNQDGDLEPKGATQNLDMGGGNDVGLVGGTVSFTLDEGASLAASEVTSAGDPIDQQTETGSIFGDISQSGSLEGVAFSSNEFDPGDPDTYYRSTAVPIYDSLGNEHTLTQYFVKERDAEGAPGTVWSVYLQIDGQDIGYDSGATNNEPSLARHEIRFDDNGNYDPNNPPIEITNWQPTDSDGRPIAAGPVPGDTNVADLQTNSNFTLDLSGLTQYGGEFSVQSNQQDGYAKGQLSGLEINSAGLVSARFSNGQSRAIGEVALANFANPDGLANLGGTSFAETSESGQATISGAGTAGLGAIQSGALEESNVDLPEQLVQLIVSQRNYQAASQVISATDQTTQTIINL
ncbi:MAG: flagellar hook-basal body complex protein [Pseudomonadota bacterium]